MAQPQTNQGENWNMNLRYLDFIYMLIMRYGEAYLEKDYESMYRTLNLMEHTVEPKTSNSQTEKNLEIIWENLGKMEARDQNGNLMWVRPQTIRNTEQLMDKTYTMILQQLETEGMLTFKGKDPRKAMGNFGSS